MLYTNFFSKVWYTPLSEREALVPSRFLLKPINYKTYSDIYSRQVLPDGIAKLQLHDVILQESICEVENLYITEDVLLSDMLPLEIKNEILSVIMEMYFPDQKFYETLNLSLDIAINPRFSGETWNCDVCQARKLHYQRNCYLVPEEEHEDSFSIQILDEVVRTCPMNKKDNILVDAALSARSMKESGSLPEIGGLGDQTAFYVIASQKAHSVIEDYKNRQMEEHSMKSKNR